MISTLFSSLNTDLEEEESIEDLQNIQPVLIVMQKTMPIFRQIAELWVDEIDVLEVIKSIMDRNRLIISLTTLESRKVHKYFLFFLILKT